MWGCTFALLGAAILGPQIYVTPIFGLSPTNWLEITLYTSGVLTSHPVIAWNIYKYDKLGKISSSCSSAWFFSYRSYRDKTGMMRSCFEAAKPLYPLVSLFIISTTWAYLSPNFILKHDPRVFFMITGTIFSNFSVSCFWNLSEFTNLRKNAPPAFMTLKCFKMKMKILAIPSLLNIFWSGDISGDEVSMQITKYLPKLQLQCRLIVAQMSNTMCDGWNFQLSVYTAAVLFCITPYHLLSLPALSFAAEKWILYSLLVVFSIQHFHYGYGVITEMCEHFGIKCFTVWTKRFPQPFSLFINKSPPSAD